MNPGLIILLAAAALFVMNKNSVNPTGAPAITTDQKRKAINNFYIMNSSAVDQQQDGGRFQDIINNISPGEIDTIYTYVFSYLVNNNRPAPGSALYNQMQIIINQYDIFS